MTSEKVRHYHATHQKQIVWKDEYIAPDKTFGGWIEIKMLEDESDKGTWHETWSFSPKMPEKIYRQLMTEIHPILTILNEIEYKHSAPYIIQIDKRGRCHLLLAKVDEVITTMNLILHEGKLDWVKVA